MTEISKSIFQISGEYFERIVFVTRMSAIGDVIIAMRAINLLQRNGYFPVLVTSSALKDVALKGVNLECFVCLDKNLQPQFFYKKVEFHREDFLNLMQRVGVNKKNVWLDLQKTTRSKRAYAFFRKYLKIRIEKKFYVRKRTLFRVFLIVLAWFMMSQKKRTRVTKIVRIRDVQEQAVKKIVLRDKKEFVNFVVIQRMLSYQPRKMEEKYVCIFPGASGFIKAWPKENVRRLIDGILRQTQLNICICGAEDEEYLGEYLDFPKRERVMNMVNKMTLAQTLDLIAHALYVVTNDSFAAHAADAYRVPASVLFGATSPQFGFVPCFERISIEYENLLCSPCTRHGKSQCRYKNLKCLQHLSDKDILDKVILNQIYFSNKEI